MKYTLVTWHYTFPESWEQDLFEQQLADIGFEAFDGEKAYIQTAMLDRRLLDELAEATPHAELIACEECPDENWNQAWEDEHPEFIVPFGEHEIHIVPHCAFGAGYHETTAMMLDCLSQSPSLEGHKVLDNGCGTGILGIAAALKGANVTAVDIDEHSVESTLQNARLNGVNIDVRCADTPPEGQYDLILSNIHRNILLAQMPLYAHYLVGGGQVWLSGFYEDDCPVLLQAAERAGLRLVRQYNNNEWRLLLLYRPLTD